MSRPGNAGAPHASRAKGEARLRVYVSVWGALMALVAATVGSSFIPLGGWNSAINLLIACLKALLVAVFFMHLRHASVLVRIVALVSVVWLSILLGLSLTDVLTRGGG